MSFYVHKYFSSEFVSVLIALTLPLSIPEMFYLQLHAFTAAQIAECMYVKLH